jgi:hypothetical protein
VVHALPPACMFTLPVPSLVPAASNDTIGAVAERLAPAVYQISTFLLPALLR